jgi:hypothetical protein
MVVTSILESKDITLFFVEEMMGSLMSHESRLNLEEGSMQHAFKTHIIKNSLNTHITKEKEVENGQTSK